jgi:hypothetical protein
MYIVIENPAKLTKVAETIDTGTSKSITVERTNQMQ